MRCKECKDIFEPKYFNQKYCMLKDECIKAHVEFSKKQHKKDWSKRKKKIKEDIMSVQELMKLTQVVFNTYIRERDKGKKCISCPTILGQTRSTGTVLDLYENTNPKKYDAGHYFSSGGHKSITFNEDNCHGQCVYCNQHLHGSLIEYREGLIERIGQERVDKLTANAYLTVKYTREELRDLIAEYKQKTKDLKNKSK